MGEVEDGGRHRCSGSVAIVDRLDGVVVDVAIDSIGLLVGLLATIGSIEGGG
jgi:hypothetical protein